MKYVSSENPKETGIGERGGARRDMKMVLEKGNVGLRVWIRANWFRKQFNGRLP
jgi:hypothetical protein